MNLYLGRIFTKVGYIKICYDGLIMLKVSIIWRLICVEHNQVRNVESKRQIRNRKKCMYET